MKRDPQPARSPSRPSITRHGTIVGPFMTSLIGHPELTPYRGGWCGNDIFPDALLARAARAQARG